MKITSAQRLKILQLAILAVLIFGFCFVRISDYDFWWHLSLGRDFFDWGFSDLTEKLSYTFSGSEQFRGEWLADLLLFLSVKAGGLAGANLLLFLTISGTFILLAKTMEIDRPEGEENRFYAGLITLILVLFALRFRLFIRPYIFSYLFVAAFLYLLTKYKKDRSIVSLYLLLPVELLWANMSKGAFFGPVILALFVVDHYLRDKDDRRPLLALLATLLVSLISTEGYNLYLDLFRFAQQGHGVAIVGEHQPLTAQLLWGYGLKYTFGYQLLVLLSLLSFVWLKGWKNYFHLSLFIIFLLPSFLLIRMIDFFAIVAALFVVPVIAKLITHTINVRLSRPVPALLFSAGLLLLTVFATFGSHTYTLGVGAKRDTFPEGALEFVNEQKIQGGMFNSYPFGGYLSWAAPDRPLFIDGRINQLYPPEFHKEYEKMLHTPVAWSAAEQKWNFDYAIVEYDLRSFGQHFPKHLEKNPEWALVYWDNISAVYLKRVAKNLPTIEKFEYKVARPAFNDFSYISEQMKLFRSRELLGQIDREIGYNRDNQEPHLLKAYLLFSLNRNGSLNKQILAEIDECLRLKPDLAMEHSAKAMILIEEKRVDEAIVEYKKAIKLDPSDMAAQAVREKLKLKL